MNNTIQALKIAQTNIKNTINSQTKKLNFTNKFDEVDLSTKPKMSKGKKALIITGAAVGAAAITAGIVALAYRGKIKNIQTYKTNYPVLPYKTFHKKAKAFFLLFCHFWKNGLF